MYKKNYVFNNVFLNRGSTKLRNVLFAKTVYISYFFTLLLPFFMCITVKCIKIEQK